MLTDTEASLDSKLNVLANPRRLERFVLRFVSEEERALARERLARFRPLELLAHTAAEALQRKGVPYSSVDTDDDRRDLIRRAVAAGVISRRTCDWPPSVFLALHPRICAQVISVSSGYALPDVAARIVQDAVAGRENWCEWLDACYGRSARKCVTEALSGPSRRCERKATGFSGLKRGEQTVAKAMLGMAMQFASWF